LQFAAAVFVIGSYFWSERLTKQRREGAADSDEQPAQQRAPRRQVQTNAQVGD
ncbi:MAG: hypothetical protein H7Y11_14630, partial [Armatimonadetes bacterium]|nr:hypothetical protein [Anaerolineae bacterium]